MEENIKQEMIRTEVVPQAIIDDITFVVAGDKECLVRINRPGWDVTVECFKNLYDAEGRLDLLTAGKLLFDLTCVEYGEVLEGNVQLMMTVASTLATKYLLPVDAQLKKNEGN